MNERLFCRTLLDLRFCPEGRADDRVARWYACLLKFSAAALSHRFPHPNRLACLPRRVETDGGFWKQQHYGRTEQETAHFLTFTQNDLLAVIAPFAQLSAV